MLQKQLFVCLPIPKFEYELRLNDEKENMEIESQIIRGQL